MMTRIPLITLSLALFQVSTSFTYAEDEKDPTLAEDPALINEKTYGDKSARPWVGKSPEEVQAWVRENLHFKLKGKRVIDEAKHPEWAWFRESGLGIFLHWGLASVPPASGNAWAMVWNERRAKDNKLVTPEEIFAAADTWNPDKYDPNKWMEAAAKAGFGYSVLTTRHHDGYCLWPTEHGEWDTGEKMGGRDLVQTYVDACRKNKIRIGLYYSGPNWHFDYKDKDFSWPSKGYNYKHEKVEGGPHLAGIMGGGKLLNNRSEVENAESAGQVRELLTNYGAIDMLWWDGNSIMKESEVHEIQPNTFVARGNIATPEGLHQGASHNVKATNEAGWWWEMCAKSENKHTEYWHYNEKNEVNHWDTNKILTELVRCRSLGGNLLLNVTPRPNGEMMDWFYETCGEMEAWMKHSREAIHGVQLNAPLPTLDKTNNFTTVKGSNWYSLPDEKNQILIKAIEKPSAVTLLRTGEALEYVYEKGVFKLLLPKESQTTLPDLVKITFSK